MNEKNLVICDTEFRYANSLGENIREREELSVKVFVCSSLERVLQLLSERTIHIFVVDEAYSYEERARVFADQTFVLSEGSVKDLGAKECAIIKYRSADEIIREIFEVYTERTKENLIRVMRNERAKLIAVYSPIHRVGKSQFAFALGKECAKKKKTLYINMEAYAGFDEEGLSLGDLLYYIKQGNLNLGMRLQSAVKQEEALHYLLPVPIALDLKETTSSEWKCLLEQIVQHSAYERIILDVGECVQGLYEVLELCDRVYMPILKDEISERKIKQYDSNLERMNCERLSRITYRFVMPENISEYAKIRVKEEC